jgi:hypothetical protein
MKATLRPPQARCFVYTYRDGVLSRVGHDLKLQVADWHLDIDGEALVARFSTASLKVVCAWREGQEDHRALSASDKRSIEDNIRKDVLKVRRYPEVDFEGTYRLDGEDRAHIEGEVEILERKKQLHLSARREDDEWVLRTQLDQHEFGIKPFRAFLGALRIVPVLDVEIRVNWVVP